MRISDWSSDVCSSDLRVFIARCEQKMLPEGFGIGLSGIAVKIRLEQGSDAPQTARTSPQVGLPEGFRYGGNLVQRYRSPICNVSRGESGFRRSEENTSELQSLMRISYAVLCLKKKTTIYNN